MAKPHRRARWSMAGFALLVTLPSAGFVQKYAGLAGVAAHWAVVWGILVVLARTRGWWRPMADRMRGPLLAAGCVTLAGVFVVAHPWEDGKGTGKSSDRDEALELAARHWVEEGSPYYPANDVAGPLSLLPGAVALSLPFSLAGVAAWQNFLWMGVWLIAAGRFFRDSVAAAIWLFFPLACSPSFQYEFISGGDMLSNGIYFPVLAMMFFGGIGRVPGDRPGWFHAAGICGLFALALASRPNFLLLGPMLAGAAVARGGWKQGLAWISSAGVMAVALSIYFFVWSPETFTPLSAGNKLAAFGDILPHASVVVAVATFMSAALCGLWWARKGEWQGEVFFRQVAVLLWIPMLCGVVLGSIREGWLDFTFLHPRYGLLAFYSAVLGWGSRVFGGTSHSVP